MTHSISTGRKSPSGSYLTGWGWFAVWLIAGLSGAIGLVSVGWLALVPSFAISGALVASRTARRSAWGLLSGAGLIFLFVAYVQRDGPGTTCWHSAKANGCDQYLDPSPWLIAGGTLLIGGLAGQLFSMFGRPRREE